MPFHDAPPDVPKMRHSKRRVALVIGNCDYTGVLPRLRNPVNDAKLMASRLERCGFDVQTHTNLGRAALLRAISTFKVHSRDAAFALFFFAGHGVQVERTNLLLPVDFQLRPGRPKHLLEHDVYTGGVSLYEVLDATSSAGCTLVFLDACRDNPTRDAFGSNPLPPELRSITDSGFGSVQLDEIHRNNTLIAFSADRGQKAADGLGDNSPYTEELSRLITKALPLQVILTNVRRRVLEVTANKQRPREDNTLTDNIILGSEPVDPVTTTSGPQVSPVSDPDRRPWFGIVALALIATVIAILGFSERTREFTMTFTKQLMAGLGEHSCKGDAFDIVGSGQQCVTPEDRSTWVFRDCAQAPGGRVCGPVMVVPPSIGRTGDIGRFAIAKHEVSFDDWDACHDDGGCSHKPDDSGFGRGKQPVINVSWKQVTDEYLPWLNSRLALSGSRVYRLPTTTEWQFVALAGRKVKYPTGDLNRSIANFQAADLPGNVAAPLRPLSVGSFADRDSHPWQIHDLAGNVAEWVAGCWMDSTAPVVAPSNYNGTCLRESKGGSWRDRWQRLDIKSYSRSTGGGSDAVGFRIMRLLN